ncbi:GNAT family N-acetyltransferase [Plantactinospora sp. CA-290183]|uniref:GNAT family N-acetyltransferase n=1 Tax=Plantactinospora sp. CA-290183 TaxID=3240006 RepID=UPI003D8EBD9F
MYPVMDLGLGDLRLRTLTVRDADLLVEATREESARALWGARPAGPYSLPDARAALLAWDHQSAGQVSYGVMDGARLVVAVGLMPDGAEAAELAYWVRPDQRRRGFGLRGVQAVTRWAHRDAGLHRVWLEINPANAASLRLAERAGYRFDERLPRHCRSWLADDPERDVWHDCLIWVHDEAPGRSGRGRPQPAARATGRPPDRR